MWCLHDCIARRCSFGQPYGQVCFVLPYTVVMDATPDPIAFSRGSKIFYPVIFWAYRHRSTQICNYFPGCISSRAGNIPWVHTHDFPIMQPSINILESRLVHSLLFRPDNIDSEADTARFSEDRSACPINVQRVDINLKVAIASDIGSDLLSKVDSLIFIVRTDHTPFSFTQIRKRMTKGAPKLKIEQ